MTQTQIPGTEHEGDPDLTAALEQLKIDDATLRDAKRARDKTRDRVEIRLVGLNPDRRAAIERAFALGPPVYHYTNDIGEEWEAVAELEIKIKHRKTGAAETPIGEGVDAGDDQDDDDDKPARKPRTNGVHPGLMSAAERDGNVEENEDGDITVPEKAAKKTKAKAKPRRKR